jgi:hypothetical protein
MKRFVNLSLPLAVLVIATHATTHASEQSKDLVRTLYLAEVANYCALVDENVAAGFRRERDRIIERDEVSPADYEQARSLAWKMGHAEWQNRGLGGFRNWCRTEGTQAAEFFRKLAPPPPENG